MRITIAAACLLVSLAGCADEQAEGATNLNVGDSLIGAWRYVEVTTTDSTGARATRAYQPGLLLYSESHYSMVRVDAAEPRPNFPVGTPATVEDYQAIWSPFTGQAGEFEAGADVVTHRPFVAKNPNNMDAGTFLEQSFRLQADTLWMTIVRNSLGPVVNAPQYKLVRAG
jgi:hypothetical protein